MALPAGIDTTNVIFKPSVKFSGENVKYRATVEPSQSLVWAATGQALVPYTISTISSLSASATAKLPSVDQPGFLDSNGDSITNWHYRVTVTWTNDGTQFRQVNFIQPLSSQDSINFFAIPTQGATPPVIEINGVISVNGQTGIVELTKESLDLGNVNNTADADKPVSGPQAAAIDVVSDALVTTNSNMDNMFQYLQQVDQRVTALENA